MTNEQIKVVSESQFAKTIIYKLCENPENIKKIEELASEDVSFARFCERNKIWTGAKWREVKV